MSVMPKPKAKPSPKDEKKNKKVEETPAAAPQEGEEEEETKEGGVISDGVLDAFEENTGEGTEDDPSLEEEDELDDYRMSSDEY